MITSNILQRTFYIKFNEATATAFTVDVSGRQYILTAKHVIKGIDAKDGIEVFHEGEWKNCPLSKIWFSPTSSDVACMSPVKQLSPSHDLEIDAIGNKFHLSEEIYFLGFPFRLHANVGQINNDYPIPFVKKGIISSFTVNDEGSQLIFCDGHNNPGFSGGPIVTISSQNKVTVIGIVSGYRHNEEKILANGEDTGLTYRANTGLVIGYGLSEILSEIQLNESGAIVDV